MATPATHYADSDGVCIAYQVIGDGPVDLLFLPMWFSHVEMIWNAPTRRAVLERLATFARLILFDQRGTGLSDSVAMTDVLTLEDRARDALAVLDAVGSERAALFAVGPTAGLGFFLAATHADRVRAVAVLNGSVRLQAADDYPAPAARRMEPNDDYVRTTWGTLDWGMNTGLARNDAEREELATYQRHALGPGNAVTLFRSMWHVDARDVLPAVGAPTLVMHSAENRLTPVEHGRYIADNVAGARFVELPGKGSTWVMEPHSDYLDEMEEFITGVRPAPEPDRVLATVLFTDVVGSTAKAAEIGDAAWRRLLEQHAAIVRTEVQRFRGHLIRVAGEESLATFDGPARAIRCARAIADALRSAGLSVRAGLHAGEIELLGDDIAGIAVHIGARVAALATAGEVLVSSTVKDLVAGSGIGFEPRGVHALKGVPGEWRVFAAVDA